MASPLGLTFKNDDKSDRRIPQYRVVQGKAVRSMFSDAQFSPYPTSFNAETGSVNKINNAAEIHGDTRNDISVESIIQYCSGFKSMKLDYAHFAYLKNFGVYPNNRLIIARRFAGGVGNDLTAMGSASPLATIVSYIPDSEDFIQVSFSETYTDAEGGFEEILNEIGDEVITSRDNKGAKIGSMAAKALNAIPLPGVMEGVQLEIMKKMGLNGGPYGFGSSPIGNPNLIRQAKRRDIPDKAEAGSALAFTVAITMKVEYEQKFINGVDPTLIYMDLIQNAISFGTSDAVFQYSGAFATGVTGLIKDLISGDINAIGAAIYEFVGHLISSITAVVVELANALIKPKPKEGEEEPEVTAGAVISAFLGTFTRGSIGHVVSKYKVRLVGVANALTGSPSTPWHVTIGNPKKPLFSSGDMHCTDVSLTLGKVLAFNDLPSSITLEIKLANARSLGAQEIFNRFNTGKGRSYVRFNKSFVESNDKQLSEAQMAEIDKKVAAANDEESKKKIQAAVDAKKAEDEKDKNQTQTTTTTTTTGTSQSTDKTIPDDYVVDFDKEQGVEWGLAQSAPPTDGTAKPDDRTQQGTGGSASGANASNQSPNDPNTQTSNVGPGTSQSTDLQANPPGGSVSTPASENVPAQPPPKYRYEIEKLGPKKRAVVYDQAGKKVYEGEYSFTATEEVLKEEARLAIGDE